MMQVAEEIAAKVGVSAACAALDVARSSLYRARQGARPAKPRSRPTRALSDAEREKVRDTLNSQRFQDAAPRQVYASLLDQGSYLCSWRTMYRILDEYDEVRERRNQLQHPPYAQPELLATEPNQVWSWDITQLKGPVKWRYYYLYVILDIFSRYAVGWMIAKREAARLAQDLIGHTCAQQGIEQGQLTLHADRGPSMRSKPVAQLLADLGVTKTHSRPYTANDNPYSEAHFKTLKYRPAFPGRFGCVQDARAWARPFFHWYNYQHYHTGLGLMTPASVHHGLAQAVRQQRNHVLLAAYAARPERFVNGPPTAPALPAAVWINKPQEVSTTANAP
jgi:putative transposase